MWGGSAPINFSGYYAIYGDLTELGTGLTDIGSVAALGGLDEAAAVLAAAGISATYIGADEQDTTDSIYLNNMWPGTSTSTGAGDNQWANGVVPPGATSEVNSGANNYFCTPYIKEKYANFVYGVDTWNSAGYAAYDERVVGKPEPASRQVFGIWTYKPF